MKAWHEKTGEVYWKEFKSEWMKEGVKYERCQHLIERPKDTPIANILWIGENRRLLPCSLCWKAILGTVFYNMIHPGGDLPASTQIEYGIAFKTVLHVMELRAIRAEIETTINQVPFPMRLIQKAKYLFWRMRHRSIKI